MNDTANQVAAISAEQAESDALVIIKSTDAAYDIARKAIGFRKQFDTLALAYAAVESLVRTEGFPTSFAVLAAKVGSIDIAAGQPELADWPQEYHQEGIGVCVSLLGIRGLKGEDGKNVNGAGAIVLFPSYSIDAITSATGGADWLSKIVEKETAHEAFRGLRGFKSDTARGILAQSAMEMPVSIADYIESTSAGRADYSVFTANWSAILGAMRENPKFSALADAYPTQKAELVKCLRSKAYALSEFPELENMGASGAFVFAGKFAIRTVDALNEAAADAGEDEVGDSSVIQDWLDTRDEKILVAPKKPDFDPSAIDVSVFDAFLAS